MTTAIGTSSSSSGTLSSTGIGSGLDVNSIISGLMKVEQAPLTNLQRAATTIQTTISAFGAVQAAMASFRDTAAALALPSTWNATTGTSGDPSSVGVTSGAGAAPGNYAVQVTNLAAAQSTVSATYPSGDALVGAGSLHIDLGSWTTSPSAFTAQTGKTGVDVAVTASDTLSTLATKINASGAGIAASIVNDASGSRLVFSSGSTGTNNGFRVTATDSDGTNTDASGLSGLAYDPAGGTTTTTLTQAAGNATAVVNGLSVSSASNTLSNVFSGITLNLTKVTTSAVQITVAQDKDAIKTSVKGFVDAYNALSSLLSADLKYDSGTKTAGPLQADATAVSLQHQLRNMLGSPSSASSSYSTLSQVGLQFQSDGTVKINDTALSSAMANATELKKLFTNVDSANPANNGFAINLRSFGNTVLGSQGLLTSRVGGLNTKLAGNQKNQDALSSRLADTQSRLQKQYSALDTQMASLNSLSTYVTQQITNWNKGTG